MSSGPISAQAWRWLERELDRWDEADPPLRFWWRDDDASTAGDRLDRLVALCTERRLPLAIAAIPARLEKGLAESLREQPDIRVLQHGFAHRNHAAAGQRKLELGGTRSAAWINDLP